MRCLPGVAHRLGPFGCGKARLKPLRRLFRMDAVSFKNPKNAIGHGGRRISRSCFHNEHLIGQTSLLVALRKRGYALRRDSEARTQARNCSGVLVGGAGAGFGVTAAGAAAFFVAVRTSIRASCLVAKSFASASTVSAGEPSRAMR